MGGCLSGWGECVSNRGLVMDCDSACLAEGGSKGACSLFPCRCQPPHIGRPAALGDQPAGNTRPTGPNPYTTHPLCMCASTHPPPRTAHPVAVQLDDQGPLGTEGTAEVILGVVAVSLDCRHTWEVSGQGWWVGWGGGVLRLMAATPVVHGTQRIHFAEDKHKGGCKHPQ